MVRLTYNKCPPGDICISGGLGTTIAIILGVTLLFMFIAVFLKNQQMQMQPLQPLQQMQPMSQMQQPTQPIIIQNGGDSRYDRAPQPLRDWMARPEFPPRGGIASIPINIPTQGLPESFQSVGIVNVGEQILPLYGRRTTGGSDRWNYYTRTDTYNPVPIPVTFQKRDCMDDVGCQEILSGETIKIDAMKKEGKTNIYRFDGPKYIPGLI